MAHPAKLEPGKAAEIAEELEDQNSLLYARSPDKWDAMHWQR